LKNFKGQIFTTDFIFAATIFLFILVISITSFGLIQNSLSQEEFFGEMQEKAVNASQILISTQGTPNSWELSESLAIDSIGITKERNIIDELKFKKLIEWNSSNYEEVKDLLGLGKYNFYFKLTEMNGKIIEESGVFPSDSDKTIVIERYVLFEGEEKKFLLGVFE